jgi:uncharacterized protein Yka (UPF0111/DUF47 family)
MCKIKDKLRSLVRRYYQVQEELEQAVELFGDQFEKTEPVKRIRQHLQALEEALEDCKELRLHQLQSLKIKES